MTALSPIGNYVVTGLTSESQNRQSNNSALSNPVGIASTAVSNLQILSKKFDEQALGGAQSTIDLINTKKQQIVDLCAQALGVFVPGKSEPGCALASVKSNVNTNIDSEKGVIPANTGVGGTPTPAVAYSVVRPDRIRIERYPRLEGRQSPDDNALAGLKFPVLTTGNAGQGKQNIMFTNGRWYSGIVTYYCIDDDGNWTINSDEWSGGDKIGRYYEITGPGSGNITVYGSVSSANNIFTPDAEYAKYLNSFVGIQSGSWDVSGPTAAVNVQWDPKTGQLEPTIGFGSIPGGSGVLTIASSQTCNAIASQITVLENEIVALRAGINTWFSASNTTKERKHSQQLRIWSYDRVKAYNNQEIANIATAVPTTESVDPQLPEYPGKTIDTTNITIDATNITIDLN